MIAPEPSRTTYTSSSACGLWGSGTGGTYTPTSSPGDSWTTSYPPLPARNRSVTSVMFAPCIAGRLHPASRHARGRERPARRRRTRIRGERETRRPSAVRRHRHRTSVRRGRPWRVRPRPSCRTPRPAPPRRALVGASGLRAPGPRDGDRNHGRGSHGPADPPARRRRGIDSPRMSSIVSSTRPGGMSRAASFLRISPTDCARAASERTANRRARVRLSFSSTCA